MNSFHSKLMKKTEAIEAEMKHLGIWTNKPLDKNIPTGIEPFGRKTMSFEGWLQFVFIPKVHLAIKNKETLPLDSQVGAYAIREFDSKPEYGNLVLLLSEFDQIILNQASLSKKNIIFLIIILLVSFALSFIFIEYYL